MFIFFTGLFLVLLCCACFAQYYAGLKYSKKHGNNFKGAIIRSLLLIFLVSWSFIIGGKGQVWFPIPLPAPFTLTHWKELDHWWGQYFFIFSLIIIIFPSVLYFIAYLRNRNAPKEYCENTTIK